MEDARRARRAWAISGSVALFGAAWLTVRAGTLLRPRWPVFVASWALVTLVGSGVFLPTRYWRLLGGGVATMRLTAVLLFIATWQGDARELLGGLAVWVAFRDGLLGRAGSRPLVPAAIALIVCLVYSSEHADQIPGRTILVSVLAALAAAAGHRARRD